MTRLWSAVLTLGCILVDLASRHMTPPALPTWDDADIERCMACRANRRQAREYMGHDSVGHD